MVEPAKQIPVSTQEEDHKRKEGARLTKASGPSVQADEGVRIGGDLKMQKNPAYIPERKAVFEELYEAQVNKYKGKSTRANE
jgi:hypothetical protein